MQVQKAFSQILRLITASQKMYIQYGEIVI